MSPVGTMPHIPVMREEVLEGLRCRPGGLYVDCTLGSAGHAEAILEASGPDGRLLGIDQDREALDRSRERLRRFGERALLKKGNFDHLPELLAESGIGRADGMLFDLGVSSEQLDEPERGFSFRGEGPLDMRMDREAGLRAEALVNELEEPALCDLLRRLGEERWAKRIARDIVRIRGTRRITRSDELGEIVYRAIPRRAHPSNIHPATRTFMALRIAVNRELEILKKAVADAVEVLKPGGRLCILSYHSLEDRTVKQAFLDLEKVCTCPPDFPACVCGRTPLLHRINRRPIRPRPGEVFENPKSRSAKLRIGERA